MTTPAYGNKMNKRLIGLEIAAIITALAQLTGWMRPEISPIWAEIIGGIIFSLGILIATTGRIWLAENYAPACNMAPPTRVITSGPYKTGIPCTPAPY